MALNFTMSYSLSPFEFAIDNNIFFHNILLLITNGQNNTSYVALKL